jgi:hypothetical protein
MRRLLLGASLVIFTGTAGFVLAQTKTPEPRPNHISYEKSVVHSPTHAFNVQLKKAVDEISKDMKTGKLTQSQAQTVMEKVKAIRIQELQFFKENGKLNQSLTELSPSL